MANATINLSVQQISNGQIPDGYTVCGGNSNYCYDFSGGNFDNGKGFSFSSSQRGGGTKTIDISLQGSGGFQITNVGVVDDDASDTTDVTVPTNQSGRTWTISDTDIDQESGYFVVIVKNGSDTGITCDPRWKNG